jgi:glyceraldehyde 3-phosphate dehydrogenase
MNILLNGVGRIGKAIVRIASKYPNINIVAINEINPNIDNIAYGINYDSTYGRFDDKFFVENKSIFNKNCKIQIFQEQDLSNINLKSLNIDLIIDASGALVDKNILESLDVKNIILTHPNKIAHINTVMGVNDEMVDFDKHKIISTSSCNATALLPVLKILDENVGIECGDIATIHPLLNHQKTLDSKCIGATDRDVSCNFEFGRSATQNIIPSGTTTIEACSLVNPKFNKDLISSNSFRVPTAIVGAINCSFYLKEETDLKTIQNLFFEYEKNQTTNTLFNNTEAVVSSDFQALEYSSIIDQRFTTITNKKLLKLVLWYDNEWGYASRVIELINKIK